jgi:transcription initiation factor TFIID subunit 11
MSRRGTAAGSIAGETTTIRGEEDAEDSDLDEGDFGNATAAATVTHQETVAEKMRMRRLLESFDEQQMARYEVFRRVGLNKNAVKRLANHVLNQSVTQNVAVVIAGASKVFVGEIVERARAVQKLRGETGPLSPDCLREAYRQYKQTGLLPQSKPPKRMFR